MATRDSSPVFSSNIPGNFEMLLQKRPVDATARIPPFKKLTFRGDRGGRRAVGALWRGNL